MTLRPTYEESESGPNEVVTKAVEPNRAEKGQGELEESFLAKKSVAFIAGILILFGLYLSSLYNYLLFHSLAEIFSIVVAWTIFILAWNSRRIIDNNYLLFIGIAFLFIGGLDLVHTLGYKGMGIFHGYAANLPTQLWIAARYMESLSFLIAPVFLTRRLRVDLVLIVYALVTALVLGLVFYWHIFPTCFLEGVGLTPFKKISEYIISIILIGAITFLFQKRKEFDEKVFRLLVAAMVITIAAELAFTFYISAYGFSNLVGHYFKIISFYLIYKAIIETGLTKPFNLLFRNLKQSEEAAWKEKEFSEGLIDTAQVIILVLDTEGRIVRFNPYMEGLCGYKLEEVQGRDWFTTFLPEQDYDCIREVFKVAVSDTNTQGHINPIVAKDGREIITEWYDKTLKDPDGKTIGLVAIGQDITERKQVEDALRESEKKFSALFHASPVYIAFTSFNDGGFLDVNDAFTKVTGFERNEVLGRTPIQIGLWFAPEERSKYIELAQQYGGFHEEEVRFRKKNGDPLYGFWSAEKIELGGKACLISVFVDTTERKKAQEALRQERDKLRTALSEIKTLSGLVPICSNCKKIRDDQGYWSQIEKYIGERSNAQFSHGICPECAKKLYPEFELYDDEGKLIQ